MGSAELQKRINIALEVACQFGPTEGGHHKMWVIDQMVRALTGDNYEQWVKSGSIYYGGQHFEEWETGVIP